MLRTQISLTKKQKNDLDRASAIEGVSSAEIVRKALEQYLVKIIRKNSERQNKIDTLAGAWKGGSWDNIDAREWQRSLRREGGY